MFYQTQIYLYLHLYDTVYVMKRVGALEFYLVGVLHSTEMVESTATLLRVTYTQ